MAMNTSEKDNTEKDHEGQDEMTEHKHGEMDTEVQEKTFEGFVKIVTWTTVAIIGILIFIALIGA
ncbi:MAG: aa3-type cytochrome c oxidase subunit IV [Roseovarius sp.]